MARLQIQSHWIWRQAQVECAVNSEWNDVINFIVSCSVVDLFIHRNHKNPAFNILTLFSTNINVIVFADFASGWKKCWSTSDSVCAWSTKHGATVCLYESFIMCELTSWFFHICTVILKFVGFVAQFFGITVWCFEILKISR